jgi:hypothetical protein
MKKEVMEKWVKALRSGEYNQTKNFLCTDAGYCCLGVLTDLYIQETIEQAPLFAKNWEEAYKDNEDEQTVFVFDNENETLPQEVLNWAGMKDHCGTYNSRDKCLTVLNDTGMSFEKIADVIEQNCENL